MESLFEVTLHWLRVALDAAGAFWIAIGSVVIRTGLNDFLAKEIRETVEDQKRAAAVVARTEAPFHAGTRPAQA